MGAAPLGYLMTSALPRGTPDGLARRLRRRPRRGQRGPSASTPSAATPCPRPGPATLSLTILGTVAPGAALRRTGARPGDRVWVSGTHRRRRARPPRAARRAARRTRRATSPAATGCREPRLALGAALAGVARRRDGRVRRAAAGPRPPLPRLRLRRGAWRRPPCRSRTPARAAVAIRPRTACGWRSPAGTTTNSSSPPRRSGRRRSWPARRQAGTPVTPGRPLRRRPAGGRGARRRRAPRSRRRNREDGAISDALPPPRHRAGAT